MGALFRLCEGNTSLGINENESLRDITPIADKAWLTPWGHPLTCVKILKQEGSEVKTKNRSLDYETIYPKSLGKLEHARAGGPTARSPFAGEVTTTSITSGITTTTLHS